MWFALAWGVFALVCSVFFLLIEASGSGVRGWHLPWPVLQWILTTLPGNLLLVALCLVVSGPVCVLAGVWSSRLYIVRARDVTDLPLAAWPTSREVFREALRTAHRSHWLGTGRWERVVSLALLVLGLLLAIALITVAGLALSTEPDFGALCSNQYGCPPVISTLWTFVAIWLPLPVVYVARSCWLRHAETTCGVWFRGAEALASTTPLAYVRQPEVTAEAASAALVLVSRTRTVPLARQVFFGVLILSALEVPPLIALVLNAWLPSQWLPG